MAENKVRFTHVEDLQGLLAPVFEALMGRSVQRHHGTFNESRSGSASEEPADRHGRSRGFGQHSGGRSERTEDRGC
jgi:hypothetical protein